MNTGIAAARVVVSGVGVVSPIGIGNSAFWNSLMERRSGVGRSRNHPSLFAAEVHDFDPRKHLPKKKFLKVMSRDIQLGVGSAMLAMRDAALKKGSIVPDRLGVVFGAGRMSTTPQELADSVVRFRRSQTPFRMQEWQTTDMQRIAPLWLLRQLPNMPACHISIAFDARGPNNTITNRDTSAIMSLMEAVNVIQRGDADAMIVGACGSVTGAVDLAKFCRFEEIATNGPPEQACRPFDRDRQGTVPGEGAGAFVVERLDHAEQRGAKLYAEILGFGAGCDGSLKDNESQGSAGLNNAIRAAMQTAKISPQDIGHINAQGYASPREDFLEARSYHETLGPDASKIPVTALKSFLGHSDAGSGAIELAGALLAIQNERVPATLNYEHPDPNCDLNIVSGHGIELIHPTALCINRTRLGQSAAVVLRAM